MKMATWNIERPYKNDQRFFSIMQWTEGCLNFTASEDDIIRGIETVYCGGYYFDVKGYEKELE